MTFISSRQQSNETLQKIQDINNNMALAGLLRLETKSITNEITQLNNSINSNLARVS